MRAVRILLVVLALLLASTPRQPAPRYGSIPARTSPASDLGEPAAGAPSGASHPGARLANGTGQPSPTTPGSAPRPLARNDHRTIAERAASAVLGGSAVEMRHVAPGTTPPPAIESGVASWYFAGAGLYAALPSYVDGTRVVIQACTRFACISAPVVTQCACNVGSPRPIVDLSRDAFARLAPLSRGLIIVTVEVLHP